MPPAGSAACSVWGSSRGRDESAPKPMELDSLPVCDSGSPAAGVPKKKPETLKSCLKTPTESSDPGSSGESVVSASSSVPIGPRKRSSVGMSLPICDTPFAYMLRGMRSVACVTEEHEFFDCDQGFAEVFELDFPELCCGDHDFACSGSRMLAAPPGRTHDLCSRTHDLCIRTHDLCSRTHDLCGRTHDLSSRMHDLSSRMHDLGSCRLSESVLCRMQVAMSQCLKVARHGLKVAQRVLRVLCPYLRAGFCQALRFHSAEASELNSGERCFPERERSERFPSQRHLLPKLLFLTLLVLWGYDGPYGGGCYAFGSVGSGCWDGCFRGWWSNNGFGRSMGTMGSDSPSHGSIGIHSSRCTSYSHGFFDIHSSRCTSYNHGSLSIHSSRCTSYVSGPPYGYHAKRWLEYGASGSGDATNQVCCKTGRRKALRLCQLVEVSIYVGPQISGRAVWCHELGCGFFWRSTKYWWAHHGPGVGPIFDSIVERFIPARICSSKSNANGILRAGGAGMAKIPTRPCKWGPELYKGPDWQCCRAQRRLYFSGLPACPRIEAIPGPTVVGEKYLLACERSLQLEREWAEAKLIVEGEYPTPPSYVNARVVPLQSLQLAGVQTEPEVPSTMEVGTLTSDLELAHAKHSVMARIGTITLSTGIEVWMLQNFIRSLRSGRDALAKMHEARLLMECIHMSRRYKETPQFRLEQLSNRLVGEIEEGYGYYVALSNIPAQFTGSFVFQALYGDGQIRLRSSIRPSEPLRPQRQQLILAREGPVPGLEPPSGVGVTAMTGPATMSALDNASETGPQRYTGLPLPPPREVGPLPSRDAGFPPPVEGLSLSKQIGQYLSLTSLLSEQMRWYTTRGLVVPEWCARHISLLRRKIHELQQAHHVSKEGHLPKMPAE